MRNPGDLLLSIRGLRVEVPGGSGRPPLAVVDGVDLDVEAGQVTCIAGESGAGKTLLLRTALGIAGEQVRATRGSIHLHTGHGPGLRADFPEAASTWRAPIPALRPGWASYVFQHPLQSLDPFRTVRSELSESVRVGEPSLSRQEVHARVERWLNRVGLEPAEEVAGLYPHELSGGMARRVVIAVAMACKPAVLVADELTSGLDWSIRKEVLEQVVCSVREEGVGLVLVSHDFDVVRHVADRVVVMKDGSVVESGERAHFFEPGPGTHPFTQRLQSQAALLSLSNQQRCPEAEQDTGAGT